MTVKDNHPLLKKKIERFFECPTLFEPTLHTARTCGKGHGRVEERCLTASGDLPAGYLDFPHVGQVWRLTRTRTRGEKRGQKEEHETVYGITSLSPAQAGPARLLSLVRGHWHIENKSHFVRTRATLCGTRPSTRTAPRHGVAASHRCWRPSATPASA